MLLNLYALIKENILPFLNKNQGEEDRQGPKGYCRCILGGRKIILFNFFFLKEYNKFISNFGCNLRTVIEEEAGSEAEGCAR